MRGGGALALSPGLGEACTGSPWRRVDLLALSHVLGEGVLKILGVGGLGVG